MGRAYARTIAMASACACSGLLASSAARAQDSAGSVSVDGGALRLVLGSDGAAAVSFSSTAYFDAEDPFAVPLPGAPPVPPPEPGYVVDSTVSGSGGPVTPGSGCRFYAATRQVACRAQGVQRIEVTGGSAQIGGLLNSREGIPVPVAAVGGPENNGYDIRVPGQAVTLAGGDGLDQLSATAASARIDGGPGDDFAQVSGFSVLGGPGRDALTARSGSGTLAGGDGRDQVRAHDSNPVTASGGADVDSIVVSGGQATIEGGDGTDLIHNPADGDRDQIDCGAGDDVVGSDSRWFPNAIDPSITGLFAYRLPLKLVAEDSYVNCPSLSLTIRPRGTVSVGRSTGTFTAAVAASAPARARLRLCSTREKGDCTFVADRKRLVLEPGVNRVRLTVTKGLATVLERDATLHLRAVPRGGTDATSYVGVLRFRRRPR